MPAAGSTPTLSLHSKTSGDHLVAEHLLRRAGGGKPAAMHDEDAVGVHGGQVEVVQDRDHAAAAPGKIAGDVHDHELVPDVEARHRLVEKQIARPAVEHRRPDLAKHAGQLHALLLAAGKLLVETAGKPFEVDARQRPFRQTPVLAGAARRSGRRSGRA